MECEFQVGDKVVCIDDHAPPKREQVLKHGSIYEICVIGPAYKVGRTYRGSQIAVRLLEFPDRKYVFWASRFRPLVSRSHTKSVIAEILSKVPTTQEA